MTEVGIHGLQVVPPDYRLFDWPVKGLERFLDQAASVYSSQDTVGANINTYYTHRAVSVTKLKIIYPHDFGTVYIDNLFVKNMFSYKNISLFNTVRPGACIRQVYSYDESVEVLEALNGHSI